MASSNRHWPSMFKSKPCNTQHHQWQHDINSSLMSTPCHRASYPSVGGCEEKSPDPKPRWNPKPEQIRILEAIFNSGMVNPPREEIRKIRAQLQEYGQVGDANVFYWFQNRKSRSKHKQRHLQNVKSQPQQSPNVSSFACTAVTARSSSSSSSDKSSPQSADQMAFSVCPANVIDVSNSPTASVNQHYFQSHGGELLPEPFFFPVQQAAGGASAGFSTQGFCFPELTNVVHVSPDQTVGSCSGVLRTDLMMNHEGSKKVENEKMKVQQQLSYTVTTPPPAHTIFPPHTTVTIPSTISHIQEGLRESGPARSTVFINDVAFEVAVGPFNVREAFGDDAVLLHSSGHPVLTNEWGVTLQSLQHGAFYYLVRTLTTSHDTAMDLI